jgi:hypothetical protein
MDVEQIDHLVWLFNSVGLVSGLGLRVLFPPQVVIKCTHGEQFSIQVADAPA